MPLFFVISGMTSAFQKDVTFVEFFKKKCKNLLLPYLALNLLMLPTWFVNAKYDYVYNCGVVELIKGILYSSTMKYDSPTNATWFITTLFLVDVMFFLCKKIAKDDIQLGIIVGMISLMGFLNSMVTPKYFGPWHIEVAVICLLFYYFGYIFINNYKNLEYIFKKRSNYFLTCSVLFLVGLYFIY